MHPARPSQHPDAIASGSVLDRLQAGAANLARWSAIALGFSVITSTALNGVLMALLLLAWLGSGGWGEKLRRIRDSEVALAALALMLLATAGTLWSQGASDDVVLFLNKYTKLLLIPVLVTVLADPADRRRGLMAMAAGLSLSLGLSYALSAGLLPAAWPLTGSADNPAALKNYISHNIFMAYGVLLFSVFAWQAGSVGRRWLWVAVAALAAGNVLLMVHGRSGYLVLAALAVVALFERWRWRGVGVATVLVGAAFAGAFWASPLSSTGSRWQSQRRRSGIPKLPAPRRSESAWNGTKIRSRSSATSRCWGWAPAASPRSTTIACAVSMSPRATRTISIC